MRRSCLLAVLLLAGCATRPPSPPVPSTRTVSATPAEALARVEAAVRRLGLNPTIGPSGVRAESRAPRAEWAECKLILVNDQDSETRRSDWARPGARDAAITVSFAPAAASAGTQVTVAARFAATYVNRFTNLPVTAACASTGTVERALLDAAAGGGA